MHTMSSSPSSPPDRTAKARARRVLFDFGASNSAVPSSSAAAISAATANPSQNKHYYRHSRHLSSPSYPRSTVTDVPDGSDDGRHSVRSGASRSRGVLSTAPVGAAAAASAAAAAAAAGETPPSNTAANAPKTANDHGTNPKHASSGPPPMNTNINPALGVNPIFTHLNTPYYPHQAYPGQYYPAAAAATPALSAYPAALPSTFAFAAPPATMATAMAGDTSSSGINFVPAVPDATNGPMLHTYMPRNDVPLMAVPGPGGVGFVYVQSPLGYPTAGTPLAAYPMAGGIATSTAPMMPFMANAQPGMPQPMFVPPGGCSPAVMMPGVAGYGGVGGTAMPGCYYGPGAGGAIHPEPAMGVGQTPQEVLQEQLEFAYTNNLNEPQDFKPADDDKSRFYWVRELDGNWTQRSRATIDHIGCRWYTTDNGVFYAVRLPN